MALLLLDQGTEAWPVKQEPAGDEDRRNDTRYLATARGNRDWDRDHSLYSCPLSD